MAILIIFSCAFVDATQSVLADMSSTDTLDVIPVNNVVVTLYILGINDEKYTAKITAIIVPKKSWYLIRYKKREIKREISILFIIY
ncbi:hypothetical protein MASR1M31_20610 [Porphyromonadaceae bacterium]